MTQNEILDEINRIIKKLTKIKDELKKLLRPPKPWSFSLYTKLHPVKECSVLSNIWCSLHDPRGREVKGRVNYT